MASFTEIVRMLADGEEVAAGITNRPLRTLDQNIRYLRDLLEASVRGDTLIAHNQLVDSSTLVGHPVFYEDATQSLNKALGATEQDADTGAFITSPSAQVWGIILEKHSATSADILLHGMGEIDLSNAIDGDIESGLYFLSNQTAGKLVKQRPPVGVTVLQVGPETEDDKRVVFVNTHFHDLLESHRHFKFTLNVHPAGDTTPPTTGEDHEITNSDDSIEGWLPADHAVFDGKAPYGANFGYNLSVSRLKNLWPPEPIEGVYVELQPGGEGKENLGVSVDDQLCKVDRNGIWWMSASYQNVPWDSDFNSDEMESLSEVDAYPIVLERRLRIWFTRPTFANNGTWVSSLAAREGSGLVVSCIDNGDAASTGHLLIDLDLALTIGDTDVAGHLAFKGIDTDTKKFNLGPIVESLKSGSSNVNLTSDVDPVSGKYAGNIQVSVDQDLSAGQLDIDVARLNGVDEEYFDGVLGLGFSAGAIASYRARLNVPTGITLPEGTGIKLVFWVLNRSTAPIPADIFSLTYRRIPDPGSTPADLPLSASEIPLESIPADEISVDSTVNRYVAIETESFEVAAGDEILFEIARAGNTDGANLDIYVIRQFALYVAP